MSAEGCRLTVAGWAWRLTGAGPMVVTAGGERTIPGRLSATLTAVLAPFVTIPFVTMRPPRGWKLATAQLVIWSPGLGERLQCRADEITWLDRRLLSAGSDDTLHRSPRCAGVRYLDHGWELFSRDMSHEVYVRPQAGGGMPGYAQVRATATHVLPVARQGFEPYPLRLENGSWLVSVGRWVLALHVEGADDRGGSPVAADSFERKSMARLAIAYYYQEFILGAVGPVMMPITEVAAALDLAGEAAVSEYKKELQRLIWNEQGHQRDLAEFLIANGLVGTADVELAGRIAAANLRSGKTSSARARLSYRQKKDLGPESARPHSLPRPQRGSSLSNTMT